MAQGKKMALGKHSGLENEWKEEEKKNPHEQRAENNEDDKEQRRKSFEKEKTGDGEGGRGGRGNKQRQRKKENFEERALIENGLRAQQVPQKSEWKQKLNASCNRNVRKDGICKMNNCICTIVQGRLTIL